MLADGLLRQAETEVKDEVLASDPLARAINAVEKELHIDTSTEQGQASKGPKASFELQETYNPETKDQR